MWADWLHLRKSKRAAVTPTALAGVIREATKAGWAVEAALAECCARGWTGFKADWVAGRPPPGRLPTLAAVAAQYGVLPPGPTPIPDPMTVEMPDDGYPLTLR